MYLKIHSSSTPEQTAQAHVNRKKESSLCPFRTNRRRVQNHVRSSTHTMESKTTELISIKFGLRRLIRQVVERTVMSVRDSMSTQNLRSTVTNFLPSSSHCKESAPY